MKVPAPPMTLPAAPPTDHALYEHAPCGLISIAESGVIERVNQQLCAWLGTSADQLIGVKRLQDLLTIGCKIFYQTHWMPLMQIQGSVAEVQLELVHSDGRAIPMIVNASSRREGGAVRHDIAMIVVADRRTYERELLQARRRAEELLESERRAQGELQALLRAQRQASQERALVAEQLIGIVSHDLRTPLHVISLATSVLKAGGLLEPQERIVGRVVTASERAKRLIGDLLDFTQARLGGGLRATLETLDLHALVSDGIEELRRVWPGRMIEHRRFGPSEVSADPDRLSQVVTNLASNALTYGTAERPVTVTSCAYGSPTSSGVTSQGPS